MKQNTQNFKRINFSESARERDPVKLIRKKITYLAGADKNNPEVTKNFIREVRTAIQGVKKLAFKRHGQEAARLFSEADKLTAELELALKANPMRDHADHRTLVSISLQDGAMPCSN